MKEPTKITLYGFLSLLSLLVVGLGTIMYWDVRDVVFWGVMALWWQQMALRRG